MIVAAVSFACAFACLGIGRWGRHNSADLVPQTLTADSRAKNERSLRRGAWSMTIFGGLFVVSGLIAGVSAAMGVGS